MTQQEFTNRYQFSIKDDKIGGGSFGTVYKAYDNVLDREVAIKVSEVKYVGDKEFSLLEEFKAIEKVPENKNIANYEEVFRFESFNGVYDYGLMQYYPLGNLSAYLKNNSVSPQEKEKLVLSILEGIGFLHQHKVVHRDLKPSNILVVNRKGELIPKITDFGLSKQASTDAKGSRFTNSFAGGTLQYSSPEQLKGLPLKLNTDLWSFGVIAYEILTGNTLFNTQSNSTASAEWQNEITQKILHEDVTPALQSLPENWRNVVAYCLERDINKRAKTTKDLQSLLRDEQKPQNIAQAPATPNDNATIIADSKPQQITRNKTTIIPDNKSTAIKITPQIEPNKNKIKQFENVESSNSSKTSSLNYWTKLLSNPKNITYGKKLSIFGIIIFLLTIVIIIITDIGFYGSHLFILCFWLIYMLLFYVFAVKIKIIYKVLIGLFLLILFTSFGFIFSLSSLIYWIVFWIKVKKIKHHKTVNSN